MTAITTRAQRERLLEVFHRTELYEYDKKFVSSKQWHAHAPATYKDFRRRVYPTFGCDGAVTINWCGMWLCIEKDGYCHS